MDIHFSKSNIKNNASVTLPSSKSLSHRALITAALAKGISYIHGVSSSKDIQATISVLEHLGVVFEQKDNTIIVHGNGGKLQYDQEILDCNESGSTLRFMIPLAALCNELISFTGHGRLMERPQSVYESLFEEKQILFKKEDSILNVQGPLKGGEFTVHGDVSSQFITGLLFALPLCNQDSVIHIVPPFESASYITLTIDALKKACIQIEQNGLDFYVPGNQNYQPIDCTVEGDDSQMAFFCELALTQNKDVRILNLNHDSHQGDHVILDFVKQMGADIKEIENGYQIIPNQLHATTISLADCPDLGPALFALATQCEGTTTFEHCERLRIKESDRIAAMEEELRKLGCEIHSDDGTVIVNGPTVLKRNVTLQGHNDHRIVMALSMLALLTDDVVIQGCEAIQKSYPQFFDDLKNMGVNYD